MIAAKPLSFRFLARLVLALGLGLGLARLAAAQDMETPARQAILLDMSSGAVLFEKNADAPMAPSSMSKMMTVYIAFDEIKKGKLALTDTATVSAQAWRQWAGSEASLMFLGVGEEVTIENLLHGIIVSSGNDACTVLAEHLAGTEEGFANWMNDKAKELGLRGSHFTNASGWPDPEQHVTARDLALLAARTVSDFPELYKFYGEKTFTYGTSLQGRPITQSNRNPIMEGDLSEPRRPVRGADGLKTGHTAEAGYGFAGSAERDGRRLVLVLNGLASKRERADESARILEWGFRNFATYALFKAGETVDEAETWLGDQGKLPLVIERDLVLSLSRQGRANLTAKVSYDGPIRAPITKGEQVARLDIEAGGMAPLSIPLAAGADVAKIGGLAKLKAALEYLVWGASTDRAAP
ncbi:MAG: D-alanyl-D-alanine carboxypeptidase family protein [Pseudomonadota bacterium]